MKTVNYGSKYTHRITLRLSDEQFNFITDISRVLGVNPCDYLRMSINSSMCLSKDSFNPQKRTVGTNENVKTDFNNII